MLLNAGLSDNTNKIVESHAAKIRITKAQLEYKRSRLDAIYDFEKWLREKYGSETKILRFINENPISGKYIVHYNPEIVEYYFLNYMPTMNYFEKSFKQYYEEAVKEANSEKDKINLVFVFNNEHGIKHGIKILKETNLNSVFKQIVNAGNHVIFSSVYPGKVYLKHIFHKLKD